VSGDEAIRYRVMTGPEPHRDPAGSDRRRLVEIAPAKALALLAGVAYGRGLCCIERSHDRGRLGR
jgi:hypothetical protein